MKQYLLLAALTVSLGACQETDSNEDATPVAIEAQFSQDFTLSYRQQAILPTVIQPELTIELVDLQYSICPKNARCFGANFAFPILAVTDAQGQTQQLKMPVNHTTGLRYGSFVDTTSVRANGRRYLLQYTEWSVKSDCDQPEKKDLSVALRITKQTVN
ncbi:hypothetical protein [Hymenobacter sp. APR13]|uniref:hypothetical protein n=1 Tax=Hymenobacter sp. APR13 TaxID=1356852 RepID=UPI0004E07D17|nr:hypothetical protein [Hymenobacter sp. APR13]AII53420.1 hypothetical protein N008_15725 [Hymenobacter sp. APR13]